MEHARNCNENRAEIIDAPSICPRPPVKLRLATVRDCRRELGRLYTEARAGEIAPADATRFAFLLQTMVAFIRDSDFEQRLARLEESNHDR